MSDNATTAPVPDFMRPGARYTMAMQPPRTVHSPALGWDYEIQVALPASYDVTGDKKYPVLWLTDGPTLFPLTVGILNTLFVGGVAPEMIVVGVGCAGEAGVGEFGRRRNIDFRPPGRANFEGPGGQILRDSVGNQPDGQADEERDGQADDFLDFLIDHLRPELSQMYRMDDDHGLLGHSGGGMFANYALFARPGGFRRYIIGSPSSNAVGKAAFRMEAEYATTNDDMDAHLFFGAGEKEIGQLFMAAWGIVSAPVLMAETLVVRRYPSLKITTRIFPGKDHFAVMADIVGEGIRAVWADRLES